MTSPMFAPLRPEETAASVPVASADEWKALIPVPADVPRSIPKHALGQPSAWWKYQDASGTLLGLAVRFDPPGGKQVLPLTYCEGPNGIREWRWKAFPEPRPLYGLDRLAQRPTVRVVVTEGEKAADAAAKMFPDVVAITWPGGAKATAKADWSPLAGRDVLLWPDHDQPGRDAMTAVADELAAVGAAALALVNVPAEFPEGWDLADAPPVGWNTDRLGLLIDTARRIETVSEVQRDEGVGNIEAEISRLAALPPIEYQTQRKTAAKRLGGMRASALDDFVKAKREENSPAPSKSNALELPTPEPWPDPVEGAALLSNMTAAIRRHVVMEEGAPEIVAFWVIYAHALDAFGISPRLSITSPEKGCGKTTALDVVGRLVPRPLHVANISAAAIFRTIEAAQPTLLIDEGDTFLKDNDEIRGILNSGHRKSAAFVVRTVGDDHEPRKFSTWAATAIAMIGRLPDTLEVRSVPVRLRRRLDSETIESLRGDKASHLDVLGRMAARWALDNFEAIRAADPVMPDGIINRAADNWRPILAIADVAGGEWPERMRQ
ncbi:MAG: DUF3631 domain-containing protein, partial [Alphaproteobacteria bacterium]|nr:DUF3631 domain-containing protein [Alphaproteobacteria bacterium]